VSFRWTPKKYRVVMEHTITITNEVIVRGAASFQEAEGAACLRWKKYPTNESDRRHIAVTMTPTKFTTTKLEEKMND